MSSVWSNFWRSLVVMLTIQLRNEGKRTLWRCMHALHSVASVLHPQWNVYLVRAWCVIKSVHILRGKEKRCRQKKERTTAEGGRLCHFQKFLFKCFQLQTFESNTGTNLHSGSILIWSMHVLTSTLTCHQETAESYRLCGIVLNACKPLL